MELDQETVTLPDIYELQKKLEECMSKSQEWEDRARKAEERCIKLESYISVENETKIETSERNDRALVGTARVEEDYVPVVQTRENHLEEQTTLVQNKNGVTVEVQCGLQETELNEEDIVTQLMIENSVLNYEKKKAESEVELLKIKHRELKCRYEMLLIGEQDAFAGSTTRKHQKNMETPENFQVVDGRKDLQAEETLSIRTPSKHPRNAKERNRSILSETQRSHRGQVKKQLKYGEDGPCKNLASLTPVVKPTLYGIIDISDNEDEPNVSNGVDVPDESDEDSSGENEISFVKGTPRKRKAFNVVYSDGEDEDGDDNISKNKSRFNNSEKQSDDVEDSGLNGNSMMNTSNSEDELRTQTKKRRRRLVSLSNQYRKDGPEISLNKASEDQEEESTTRSIDNNTDTSFIRSYSTESGEASDNDDVEESKSNYEWQFEGEMLAAFGKDVDMCMRAVCALYRQQTTDEKTSKETIYHNGRGFSQCDASRGTSLAEFLTGGDPAGDLTKTVEELEEFNAEAPELCQTLAFNYSNQLFRIYKNKEDPFFLPS